MDPGYVCGTFFSVTNFTELRKFYIVPTYRQLKVSENKDIRNVGLLGKTNRENKNIIKQ